MQISPTRECTVAKVLAWTHSAQGAPHPATAALQKATADVPCILHVPPSPHVPHVPLRTLFQTVPHVLPSASARRTDRAVRPRKRTPPPSHTLSPAHHPSLNIKPCVPTSRTPVCRPRSSRTPTRSRRRRARMRAGLARSGRGAVSRRNASELILEPAVAASRASSDDPIEPPHLVTRRAGRRSRGRRPRPGPGCCVMSRCGYPLGTQLDAQWVAAATHDAAQAPAAAVPTMSRARTRRTAAASARPQSS